MYKTLLTLVFALLTFTLSAQTENQAGASHQSETTIKMAARKKKYRYFSGTAPVTMADGSLKPIAQVKVGERVKTCRAGISKSTTVSQIEMYNGPVAPLTAIYLRPAGKSPDTMVPALMLEATPDHNVQTKHGKKSMKKLSKRDILYHYEPSTGIVSSWKVGAVKENARRVSTAYNLQTEDGTYLIDNVMVANN